MNTTASWAKAVDGVSDTVRDSTYVISRAVLLTIEHQEVLRVGQQAPAYNYSIATRSQGQ